MSKNQHCRLVRLDDPNIEIRGTADIVLATAGTYGYIGEDGKPAIEYVGGSTVYWDTQETKQNPAGEALFDDENGEEVPASNVGMVLDDGSVIPIIQ